MSFRSTRLGITFILGILVSANQFFAQIKEIDSLKMLTATESGTKKIDALNELSLRLVLFDFNLAEEPIEEAFKLSKQLNYTRGLAEANLFKNDRDSPTHILQARR